MNSLSMEKHGRRVPDRMEREDCFSGLQEKKTPSILGLLLLSTFLHGCGPEHSGWVGPGCFRKGILALEGDTVVVVRAGCKIRSEPTTESEILGAVSPTVGEYIAISATDGEHDWVKIGYETGEIREIGEDSEAFGGILGGILALGLIVWVVSKLGDTNTSHSSRGKSVPQRRADYCYRCTIASRYKSIYRQFTQASNHAADLFAEARRIPSSHEAGMRRRVEAQELGRQLDQLRIQHKNSTCQCGHNLQL